MNKGDKVVISMVNGDIHAGKVIEWGFKEADQYWSTINLIEGDQIGEFKLQINLSNVSSVKTANTDNNVVDEINKRVSHEQVTTRGLDLAKLYVRRQKEKHEQDVKDIKDSLSSEELKEPKQHYEMPSFTKRTKK